MSAAAETYRLEMTGISKAFPGVQALSDVSFDLRCGEIHALVGENGAGKSTFIKILSGAYTRDAGQIRIDGENVEIAGPAQALQLGIITIYQETNLCPTLTVSENIYMGRLPCSSGMVRWQELHQQAQQLLDELKMPFSSRSLVKNLSHAQCQMVEIAKALSMSAKIIVLDEPSAALTNREVEVLFDIMRNLRARGVSIIYISHRLAEVFAISDRLTVFRDGQWVTTRATAGTTEDELVMYMVGREIQNLYSQTEVRATKPMLSVRDLAGPGFEQVSFDVAGGEIVGLFGLIGSGRTDVVSTLFGACKLEHGRIVLDDNPISPRSPEDAIRAGIALAPEDRKGFGLVLGMPVRSNISLANLSKVSRFGFIFAALERALAKGFIQTLAIRCPSPETPVKSLSGGNQQKVVIAKWLTRKPKVLVLDEPTRGIDVAGKAEVHKLMVELAAQGVAVLMVSSELPEILGLSDRILVMREGRLTGEVSRADATEKNIMALATGQGPHMSLIEGFAS